MRQDQPLIVISHYPAQRERFIKILPSSVHYGHFPDIEEIKNWKPKKIIILDYMPSARLRMAKDIEEIKKHSPKAFVLAAYNANDKKAENAAIKANADAIIKRPFSDNHLLFVLKNLSNYAKLHCADTSMVQRYRPAAIGLNKAMLGLLDANGQLRPFRDLERDIYSFALEHYQQNYEAIARNLKIARSSWYRRIHKLKLGRTKDTYSIMPNGR